MAKTVGSILSNHVGRYQTEEDDPLIITFVSNLFNNPWIVLNFDITLKSMFITSVFNLRPLHMMDSLTEKILGMKDRDFLYKRRADGRLVTHPNLLKNFIEGAAVNTHHKLQVKHSHLPVELWKKIE